MMIAGCAAAAHLSESRAGKPGSLLTEESILMSVKHYLKSTRELLDRSVEVTQRTLRGYQIA
jgi:hypothetical protein